MRIIRFNCAYYLPCRARRVTALAVVIIVVVLAVAFTGGRGEAMVAVLGAALLTAVVSEGVRAVLRVRPRNA